MIRIGNVKSGDQGIYIGRHGWGRKGSPLQNPFKLSKQETREATIERYRRHLLTKIGAQDPAVLAELRRIQKASQEGECVLVCYCSPAKCHGDVIKELLDDGLDLSMAPEAPIA